MKFFTRLFTVIVAGVLFLFTFTSCECEHKWKEATCMSPKQCLECGETEGEKAEHSWEEATCASSKKCSVCGKTEGEALEHTWVEATCSSPKTCSACGKYEGEALEHTWVEATCSSPKTCSACGKYEGKALEHAWNNAKCGENFVCSICNKKSDEKKKHEFKASSDKEQPLCTICDAPDPSYRLSKGCDAVLATGKEGDDVYELVCNQEEDYQGLHSYIGVIKNNSWLVKPTAETQFVQSDVNKPADWGIIYLGNGCFVQKEYGFSDFDTSTLDPEDEVMKELIDLYEGLDSLLVPDYVVVYNAETQKYCSVIDKDSSDPEFYFKKKFVVQDDMVFLGFSVGTHYLNYSMGTTLSNFDDPFIFYILDINTMKLHEVSPDIENGLYNGVYAGTYSDGLFAVQYMHIDEQKTYFYDINGKTVIDLSDYEIVSDGLLYFKNGECTFTIYNENKTKYNITIDKNGSVIRSEVA